MWKVILAGYLQMPRIPVLFARHYLLMAPNALLTSSMAYI